MSKSVKDTLFVLTQIRMLVAIVVVICLLVVAMLVWEIREENKIRDVSEQYHLSSLRYINNARIVLLNLQLKLHEVDAHVMEGEIRTGFENAISKQAHIINLNIKNIYRIQQQFRVEQYEHIIDNLKQAIDPVTSLVEEGKGGIDIHKLPDAKIISANLVILGQLERLHDISRVELSKKYEQDDEARVSLMLISFILIVLISIILIKLIFRSIRKILLEQKSTETMLFQEKEFLRTTLRSIGDAVIATDVRGVITTMNPIAESLTGWSVEKGIGEDINNVFSIVDSVTGEQKENPIEVVLRRKRIVHLSNHVTLISKSGKGFHIADSAAPIRDDEGNILGVILVFNDVSEQYYLREQNIRSAQHLKLYRDQTPLAFIEWNKEFQITDWNLAAEKMFGYKAEEIRKRDFDCILIPDEHTNSARENWKNRLLQGGDVKQILKNMTSDGQVVLCEWYNQKIVDESGEIIGIASIVRDVTEESRQEEMLRRSQKMDAVGKLTSGVAHDYNNVLGIILGYAEMLEERLSDYPDLAGFAHEIVRAGERGSKMTGKLLAFARSKNADTSIININQLLNDELNMLQKSLTARVDLKMDLAKDLWLVKVDQAELEDALLNMCINAMHAMAGQGELIIQTTNRTVDREQALSLGIDQGDYVCLSLTDTGEGIEKSIIDRIYEPFFTTKGEQGTGLGLSQVYGFVKRSQGAIYIESISGVGSCFTLYFPRSEQALDTSFDVEKEGENTGSENERVLVVDDETELCNLVAEVLTGEGYEVFTAYSGQHALEVMQVDEIDLVITDIIMPEMDGYQLANIIKQQYPSIKIQLVSGYADQQHADMVDEQLQANMLYKPVKMKELLATVRSLLDLPGSQRE